MSSPAPTPSPRRKRPSSRIPFRRAVALLFAAKGLLLGACILDLDGLTDGGTSGGGMGGGAGSSNGGGGGSGGAATGCPLLECAACGSTCPEGGCTPTPVAADALADRPWAVTVAGKSVYWVNQHGYSVVRRTEGSAGPEVLTEAVAPTTLAVASGYAVWAQQDGLWGCPVDSCDQAKKKLHGSIGPGTLQGVAFDGQFAYFTDLGDGNLTGKVLRCAPDACGTPLEIATSQIAPKGITLTGDAVLWADLGNGEKNGSLYKASKSGQGVTQIAGALVLPTGIVADEASVYFTQWSGDGRVLRCAHTMGYCDAPEDLAPSAFPLALPFEVALAGGRVYWSNSGDGSIQSCPLPGCGQDMPRTHVTGRVNLRTIALGASCLFGVDDTAGSSVFEVPR